MKICIEVQLYLRKSNYITEKRNISAKTEIYHRIQKLSAKIQLYLRKTNYISENRIISQKRQLSHLK